MSYTTAERTHGAVVEGFYFVQRIRFPGSILSWAYTSGERVFASEIIAGNSTTFTPLAGLSRDSIDNTTERSGTGLRVTLPRTADVVTQFQGGLPSWPVMLTVYRFHLGDGLGLAATVFTGQISAVEFNGASAILTVEPALGRLKQSVPRRLYQPTCMHMLYDSLCGINNSAFRGRGLVTGIAGNVITIAVWEFGSSYADGYFTGGYLQKQVFNQPGDVEWVTVHAALTGGTGATITILNTSTWLQVGDEINVYAGCDRTKATCLSKFNNVNNFGGFDFIPLRNPFQSGIIGIE